MGETTNLDCFYNHHFKCVFRVFDSVLKCCWFDLYRVPVRRERPALDKHSIYNRNELSVTIDDDFSSTKPKFILNLLLL